MRILSWFVVALLVVSCEKDYVSLKGKVKSSGITSFQVVSRSYMKTIAVDENGAFDDTLRVEKGLYGLLNGGSDGLNVFLKNGYDLELEFNAERFTEGATFKGTGAETNNYLESKRAYFTSESANPGVYFALDSVAFKSKLQSTKASFEEMKVGKEIDPMIIAMDVQEDETYFQYLESNYAVMHARTIKFGRGKPSPKFVNYENFDGGTSSLDDFKGKYVYLDIWATWCGPCKAEIPHLKELEKDFSDSNIEFISISVDKPQAYDAWRKMVADKSLSGVQLYADKNFESDFVRAYEINAIPRFILIDPEGNIVDFSAKRPSNPDIRNYFKELGI